MNEVWPPAAAYHVMADLLGPGYFLTDPPEDALNVMAVGADGIATRWRVARTGVVQITKDALSRRVQVRIVA